MYSYYFFFRTMDAEADDVIASGLKAFSEGNYRASVAVLEPLLAKGRKKALSATQEWTVVAALSSSYRLMGDVEASRRHARRYLGVVQDIGSGAKGSVDLLLSGPNQATNREAQQQAAQKDTALVSERTELTKALLADHVLLYTTLGAVIRVRPDPVPIFTSVVLAFSAAAPLRDFLDYCLKEEVALCTDKSTMFRQRSVFVNTMHVVLKEPEAVDFVNGIVRPISESLAKQRGDLEVDPDRSDAAAQNAQVLQQHASLLLMNLGLAWSKCPGTIRYLWLKLFQTVKSAFPGYEWNMLASMIMLRWIVPSLIMPTVEAHGNMTPAVKKACVRLGKLVQALANNQRFEPHSAEKIFNSWLDHMGDHPGVLGEGTFGPAIAGSIECDGPTDIFSKRQPGQIIDSLSCVQFAACRHQILATLEGQQATRGKYQWLLSSLEVWKQ